MIGPLAHVSFRPLNAEVENILSVCAGYFITISIDMNGSRVDSVGLGCTGAR